jgi:hypothetical protein
MFGTHLLGKRAGRSIFDGAMFGAGYRSTIDQLKRATP